MKVEISHVSKDVHGSTVLNDVTMVSVKKRAFPFMEDLITSHAAMPADKSHYRFDFIH